MKRVAQAPLSSTDQQLKSRRRVANRKKKRKFRWNALKLMNKAAYWQKKIKVNSKLKNTKFWTFKNDPQKLDPKLLNRQIWLMFQLQDTKRRGLWARWQPFLEAVPKMASFRFQMLVFSTVVISHPPPHKRPKKQHLQSLRSQSWQKVLLRVSTRACFPPIWPTSRQLWTEIALEVKYREANRNIEDKKRQNPVFWALRIHFQDHLRKLLRKSTEVQREKVEEKWENRLLLKKKVFQRRLNLLYRTKESLAVKQFQQKRAKIIGHQI